MNSNTIAVDFDGVICNSLETIANSLEKKYRVNLHPIKTPYISEMIKSSKSERLKLDFADDLLNEKICGLFNDAYESGETKITENEIPEILKKFRKRFKVDIVTSTPYFKGACKWLEKEKIIKGVNYDGIIHVDHNSRKKEKTDAFLIIEDYLKNALDFTENGNFAIILKKPWNENELKKITEENERIIAVESWFEIDKIIAEIE